MYHNITRKYNALSTYYNSFDGRVALSTKDTLEYSLTLYGGQNILKGIQAVTNITSNSTKFTLGIAGTGSVGSQMISTGSVDPKTLGIDLATAYALKGKGFTANVLGNTASGAFNSYITDQSVVNGAIGSGVGSLIGYGIGKTVELPLNKKFNPDPTWSKYNPQPLSNELPFIYSYKKNIIPEIWGNSVGELGNRLYQYQREKYNNGEKMKSKIILLFYSFFSAFCSVFFMFIVFSVINNIEFSQNIFKIDIMNDFFLDAVYIQSVIFLTGLFFVTLYLVYKSKL